MKDRNATLFSLVLAALLVTNAGAAPRERQGEVLIRAANGQAAAVRGKPTAPIAVSYALESEPALGQPLVVRIAANAADGVTGLSLGITSDAALHVGPVERVGGDDVSAEALWRVTVTPLAAGVAHLDVLVTGLRDGSELSRALSVAVRTGAKSTDGAANVKREASPRTVISLPADERR